MDFEKFEINGNNTDFAEYFGDNAEDARVRCAEKYAEAIKRLSALRMTVSTAESCTGGLIGKLFTDVPGSSAVFNGGIMAYVNDVKIGVLGVSEKTIDDHTEVSFECAAEMAERTRIIFGADIGIATTGFAGPSGGNEKDPVGTVYVAVVSKDKRLVFRASLGESTSRADIRLRSAYVAVMKLTEEFLNV